jgi:hypothetical protein
MEISLHNHNKTFVITIVCCLSRIEGIMNDKWMRRSRVIFYLLMGIFKFATYPHVVLGWQQMAESGLYLISVFWTFEYLRHFSRSVSVLFTLKTTCLRMMDGWDG